MTIGNSILWENMAAQGQEVYAAGQMPDPSYIAIRYSVVDGGQNSVKIEGDSHLDWGMGMLDTDPLFRGPGLDDYHLKAIMCGDSFDSPCIDAGDSSIVDGLLDCLHGLGSIRSDLGAYGGGGSGPPLSITSGGNRAHVSIPKSFVLYQNCPNPFNPTTTIRFDIPPEADRGSRVRLFVYDLRGRCVRVLVDAELQSGSHKIIWNGRDERGNPVASGSYLYRMQAGHHETTRKLTILK